MRQAKAEERTWPEIGEVLEITRQAAFHRFGGASGDQEGGGGGAREAR